MHCFNNRWSSQSMQDMQYIIVLAVHVLYFEEKLLLQK